MKLQNLKMRVFTMDKNNFNNSFGKSIKWIQYTKAYTEKVKSECNKYIFRVIVKCYAFTFQTSGSPYYRHADGLIEY